MPRPSIWPNCAPPTGHASGAIPGLQTSSTKLRNALKPSVRAASQKSLPSRPLPVTTAARPATSIATVSTRKTEAPASFRPHWQVVDLEHAFELAVRDGELRLTVRVRRELIGVVLHDQTLVGECEVVAGLKGPQSIPAFGIGLRVGLLRQPLRMRPTQGCIVLGPTTWCRYLIECHEDFARVVPIDELSGADAMGGTSEILPAVAFHHRQVFAAITQLGRQQHAVTCAGHLPVILLELLDACVAWSLVVVQACHDGERVIDQTREFGLVRENQRVDLERGAFSSAARLAAFPFDLLRKEPVATAHLVRSEEHTSE